MNRQKIEQIMTRAFNKVKGIRNVKAFFNDPKNKKITKQIEEVVWKKIKEEKK